MGTYISRAHRRHPRRVRVTLGPVTIDAHPWFWAATTVITIWAGIGCAFGVLLGLIP